MSRQQCASLARRLAWRGFRCAEGQAGSRPTLSADGEAESALARLADAGRHGARAPYGIVDHPADRRAHRTAAGREISPQSCRQTPAPSGLEPPETGASRGRTRRGVNRRLETVRVACSKKNAARLAAHVLFIDESGFLLIPSVRKTWSPVGQTPVVHHRYSHDRISAISGIAVSP